jgi:hypothetical protein
MAQSANSVQKHDDTKKLTFVVAFLSLFVFLIYGLVPLV